MFANASYAFWMRFPNKRRTSDAIVTNCNTNAMAYMMKYVERNNIVLCLLLASF